MCNLHSPQRTPQRPPTRQLGLVPRSQTRVWRRGLIPFEFGAQTVIKHLSQLRLRSEAQGRTPMNPLTQVSKRWANLNPDLPGSARAGAPDPSSLLRGIPQQMP